MAEKGLIQAISKTIHSLTAKIPTKGYKTYLASTILILLGLYLIVDGKTSDGIQALSTGLGLLGIRHYLQYSNQEK